MRCRLLGNAIVLVVLRSPAHRLVSGAAIELRYAGRRSGRSYVLPVEYARAGDRLVVRPQGWERKTWWCNFRSEWPVTVRLAGRLHAGTGRVVSPGTREWEEARAMLVARWGHRAGSQDTPLVVITLNQHV